MSATSQGAPAGVQLGSGTPKRQPTFLVAIQQLGPARPRPGLAAAKKSSRLAASRPAEVGDHPDPLDTVTVQHGPVLAEGRNGALDGKRVETAVPVDALTQAGDAHAPLEGPAVRMRR